MRGASKGLVALLLPLSLSAAAACGDSGDERDWRIVQQDLPGALLSVWGTGTDDIWAVGGDPDGNGSTVLRYDGSEWQELDTGTTGDLWWVFGPPGGPVYLGGAGGTMLAYRDGAFATMETPRNDVSVFGIWGCSADEMWAVGGGASGSSGGFAWRLDGERWIEAAGFPAQVVQADAVWKIFGRDCDDVWMVGTAGLAIHWDGEAFGDVERVAGGSLFTLHGNADRFVAVGGQGTGILVENDGSGWVDVTPGSIEPVVGVRLTEDGGFAGGWFGSVLARTGAAWGVEHLGMVLDETFHSVWIDPSGGVWLAGGQIVSPPLVSGILLHRD